MNYFFLIVFGLLPSVIWLSFYLRKDAHPESNLMVLKIFFWGMFITIPAAFLEREAAEGFGVLISFLPPLLVQILFWFLGVALMEEFLKYLVVRWKVLSHREFDEPLDAMLYMIIAALGFAGLENILVLFPSIASSRFWEVPLLSALRFFGATFLHALCSGLLGYFLALSFFETKKRVKLTVFGLGAAVLLHGSYNFFIINIVGSLTVQNGRFFISNFSLFLFSLISVVVILISLALFVSFGFQKLKKMKSICKISNLKCQI